jgi:RNA polymerase sigma-70 factor (ECF subfamily)
MALIDSGHAAGTPNVVIDSAADLEAGLVKLMPFMRSFARSLSGNRELAEDLVQDVLTKVWRYRASFRPGSNLKAWVFAILRNEFYSHRRRAWRQVAWDSEWAENIPIDGDQEWAVDLSDAVCALQTLPKRQREALMLVGVGGVSYDDAATLTNCAGGTMKSRVARARRSLADTLDSRRALPGKARPACGNAIADLLDDLAQLHKPRH